MVKLKIRYKIALILNALSILIIMLLSYLFYYQFSIVLKERILLQLSSIRNLKSKQIENVLADEIGTMTTMMRHLDDLPYLDAIAEDRLIDIDSIIVSYEGMGDRLSLEDISHQYDDGLIHLICHIPVDTAVYKFYFTPQDVKKVLFEHTGMGQTGETYIVGTDKTLRTQSRFFPMNAPTTIEASTVSVNDGLSGNSGMRLQNDYRNVPVFSSYAPFTAYGLQWVILSEIDREEAFYPLDSLKQNIVIISLVIITIIMVGSYPLSSRLVHPILKMQASIKRLSDGDVNVETEALDSSSSDEIGSMSRALQRLIKSISDTVVFADDISRGRLDASFTLRGENDELGKSLVNMRDQLATFQENEIKLLKANQRSLLKGEENERRRLARELHDSLGPVLTNLKTELEGFDESEQKVRMKEKIDLAVQEVRVITMNLMPSVLREFGLGEAAANLIKYHHSASPILFQYVNNVKAKSAIPEEIALNIYRIIQEAIHNVIKHAQAKTIKISLTEFENQVSLFIQDDGVGFDVEQPKSGNGLNNMRERVHIFDGMFQVTSSGDQGTEIEVEI